jgi:hypothetical protein
MPGIWKSRLPGLEKSRWRSLTSSGIWTIHGVREDGTLWYWDYREWDRPSWKDQVGAAQIGHDSDWAEMANSWQRMVLRKTDGSLWTWDLHAYWRPLAAFRQPPVRLGTHSDWVALGVVGPEIVSLAADGSLWSWPKPEPVGLFGYDSRVLLAASRKPAPIENILGAK